MNPKALIPLVAGLGIAGFAAKLGIDSLRKADAKPTELVMLWTPVQDIPRGTAISATMISQMQFPLHFAPKGAIQDKDKLIGRVPHTGAPAGVPILDSMLLPEGESAGIHVPEGLRAVAVKIDESSGVDNHLQPGCYVDVIGMFTIRNRGKSETIAKTIMEDVEVAAVGQRLAPDSPGDPENPKDAGARAAKPARAATLLVKPEQVPTLHLAEQRGKIKLSMRGAEDSGVTATAKKTVTEDELLGLEEPKPEQPEEKEDTFADHIAAFFDGLEKQQAQMPVNTPAGNGDGVSKAPQIAHQMVIYNGDDQKILGWTAADRFHPIVLSSEGPNLFEDNGWDKPKRQKKDQVNQPTNGNNDDPGSEPESDDQESEAEPEELFG